MTARQIIDALLEGEETHPELGKFKGLFSVNPLEAEHLIQNIGQWVKFKPARWQGTMHRLPFKIVHIQKIYNGSLAYRCENQLNRFGCPASPNEVELITVEEAEQLWDRLEDSTFDPDFDH